MIADVRDNQNEENPYGYHEYLKGNFDPAIEVEVTERTAADVIEDALNGMRCIAFIALAAFAVGFGPSPVAIAAPMGRLSLGVVLQYVGIFWCLSWAVVVSWLAHFVFRFCRRFPWGKEC